jgi:5-methylcytosine-specific restriction enzyme subunit McrC
VTVETVRTIELAEYRPVHFERDAIPQFIGELIWRSYRAQIAVEFPSPKTDEQWELTAQGWVGYIPLTAGLGLRLMPKVTLGNLFGMLEYAYHLKGFCFLRGLMDCGSLEEFYNRLVKILAQRILDRGRRGFYRSYVGEYDRLPFVRGRIDVRPAASMPWQIGLQCDYEEHTGDIAENQILMWTLQRVARSGMCDPLTLASAERAYRGLLGIASVRPFRPAACVGRIYNRLNQDYQTLHALCRFFLEQRGPSHIIGDRQTLPFLVDMESLFELFVAEWLGQHLPDRWTIKPHEHYQIGLHEGPSFDIDLVLQDTANGITRCVLDTKYKAAEGPSSADISQVVAYAEAKGCCEAILVYPVSLPSPLDRPVGRIRVRSLTFSLAGDLEKAGQEFLESLFTEEFDKQPT